MVGLESIRIWIEFDKNEKPLKVNLNHQTATIDAMYKFVNGSILHVDNKLKGIVDNFNTLGKMVQEDLNFTTNMKMKNILQLESEAIEIGFRIQSLFNDLSKQQNFILQIILNKGNSMPWIIQLLEPATLQKKLEEAENKIEVGLEFPGRPNGGILSGFFKQTDVSFKAENNQMLTVDLKIPLVSKRKFIAYGGSFLPQVNGSILMSIN